MIKHLQKLRKKLKLSLRKENSPNNCFNLIIPFVTLFAVATLGKKCANPFGPELQVKQMLGWRLRRIRIERWWHFESSKKKYRHNCYSYKYNFQEESKTKLYFAVQLLLERVVEVWNMLPNKVFNHDNAMSYFLQLRAWGAAKSTPWTRCGLKQCYIHAARA